MEEEKKEWEEAEIINKADGTEPSEFLKELIEKNIKGEIKEEEIIKELIKHYLKNE